MLEHEYDTMRGVEDDHWWYRALRTLVLSDLRERLSPNAPVEILDAGCGTGGMLAWLQAEGPPAWSLSGVDTSSAAVRHCHGRGQAWVIQGDMNALSFQNNTFDAVLCLDVIYNRSVNDAAALRECARVLKLGGWLLLNVAAHECLRGSHDEAVGGVRRYDPRGLRALIEAQGFRIETLHAWNGWLFVPLLLWRSLSRMITRGPSRASGRMPAPGNGDESGSGVRSDLFAMPKSLERLLAGLTILDQRICRFLRWPWGSSLYVAARLHERSPTD